MDEVSFLSNFDFYFHTACELEFHERLNGLVVAVVDVNQTLLARQLKLLTALFVNEGRAVNRENAFVRRQGNRTTYQCACCLYGLDDLLCRLVNQVVVERLQFDTNFLTHNLIVLFLIVCNSQSADNLKSHLLR